MLLTDKIRTGNVVYFILRYKQPLHKNKISKCATLIDSPLHNA